VTTSELRPCGACQGWGTIAIGVDEGLTVETIHGTKPCDEPDCEAGRAEAVRRLIDKTGRPTLTVIVTDSTGSDPIGPLTVDAALHVVEKYQGAGYRVEIRDSDVPGLVGEDRLSGEQIERINADTEQIAKAAADRKAADR
jgi:hypothetical protein